MRLEIKFRNLLLHDPLLHLDSSCRQKLKIYQINSIFSVNNTFMISVGKCTLNKSEKVCSSIELFFSFLDWQRLIDFWEQISIKKVYKASSGLSYGQFWMSNVTSMTKSFVSKVGVLNIPSKIFSVWVHVWQGAFMNSFKKPKFEWLFPWIHEILLFYLLV